mgnify:CR=1 FL=1
MPHYIILLNWTDQGIRNVKQTTKRAEAARRMAEEAGGKLQLFYTLGEYDAVGVAEMPNDEAAMRFLLTLGSLGNVRSTTLKAWTEAEEAKIVSQLP